MNIIAFGAHPDDCDQDVGGTSILWTALGHRVRLVSVTNGDAGHHVERGPALAARRAAEAREAGRRIGVEYVVLDNHDGELLPDLQVRGQVIRQIRQWKADLDSRRTEVDGKPATKAQLAGWDRALDGLADPAGPAARLRPAGCR